MTESKKDAYNSAAFMTVAKFADLYKIPHTKEEEKKILMKSAAYLYKMSKMVKNPSGKSVRAVTHNARSHNSYSMYKINPLAHEIFMQEYEKQKKIFAKNSKGEEK